VENMVIVDVASKPNNKIDSALTGDAFKTLHAERPYPY
jgi:hypothetical protein